MKGERESDTNCDGEQRRAAIQSDEEKYGKQNKAHGKADLAEKGDGDHHR
jgi:hypothetical protein